MGKKYPEGVHIRMPKEVVDDVRKYARIHRLVDEDGTILQGFSQAFRDRQNELWEKEKELDDLKRQGVGFLGASQKPAVPVPSGSIVCPVFNEVITHDECSNCAKNKMYLCKVSFCSKAKG